MRSNRSSTLPPLDMFESCSPHLRWAFKIPSVVIGGMKNAMKLQQILEAADGTIRTTPEGKYSIDDVMKFAMRDASQGHRCNTYRRVREQFELGEAERVTFPGRGPTTPVAKADELQRLLALLPAVKRPIGRPRKKRVACTRSTVDDSLYVMRYSHDSESVKIGRSRNVENRRAALEAGQNFHVEVLVVFPAKGRLESSVHMHLDSCRSTRGAGREWFSIPADEATVVVAKALRQVSVA